MRAPWYYVALVPPTGQQSDLVDMTDRVLSFEFEDHESKTDKLRLSINNFDLSGFDDPLFRHGARLRVSWGNGVDVAPIREVVVRKITGGRVLSVEADDRAVEMDAEPRQRTFYDMTRSEVAKQIAEENGWGDPDVEDTDERFEMVRQSNLTDAQMLKKLAHLEGFQFFVDFDGLHWHSRRTGQRPMHTLTYYAADPDSAGDVVDFNVENDVTRRPGRVRVKSRNPKTKEDVDAVADNETDTSRPVMQQYVAYLDGESGKLKKTAVASPVSHEETRVSSAQTQEDAQVEAKARYRVVQQTAVRMRLDLRGIPSLLAKSVITISGMGARLSGKYYVKSVKHTLDRGGYSCSAEVITDGYGRGWGGKKKAGSGETDAMLAACIQSLRNVAAELKAGPADSSSATLVFNALKGLTHSIGELVNLDGAALASGAAEVSKKATRISQEATRVGEVSAAGAASRCASILRRITHDEDIEAKGDKNDKSGAGPDLIPVAVFDPESGTVITKYIETRGRE